MMIMRRRMEYGELRDVLRGKRVAIWTCNTCARLCNGIGGAESAERLASKLRKDGVDVLRVISVSASCIMDKVLDKADDPILQRCDVLVTFLCNVGAGCARSVLSMETVNPVETLGVGYLDTNRMPLLEDGRVILMGCSPFVD